MKHKITEGSTVSTVTEFRYCPKTIRFLFDKRKLLFLLWPMQALRLIQPMSNDELLSLGGGGVVVRETC